MAGGVSGLDIRGPWRPLTEAECRRLPPSTGVYEVRRQGVVDFVGYAGGASKFGLRGELAALASSAGDAVEFRAEANSAYLTRWAELLGVHLAIHGRVPSGNESHQPPGLRPVGPRGAVAP